MQCYHVSQKHPYRCQHKGAIIKRCRLHRCKHPQYYLSDSWFGFSCSLRQIRTGVWWLQVRTSTSVSLRVSLLPDPANPSSWKRHLTPHRSQYDLIQLCECLGKKKEVVINGFWVVTMTRKCDRNVVHLSDDNVTFLPCFTTGLFVLLNCSDLSFNVKLLLYESDNHKCSDA